MAKLSTERGIAMIINQKRLTKEPTVHEHTSLKEVTFGAYNEIGVWNFIEYTDFGDYAYTGQFCFVQNARIGKFSNIAANVRIGATAHPYERASLHHFTYRPTMYGFAETDDSAFFEKRHSQQISIGHDTWIGHGAMIMPNVTVGNGAIVAAGAIVTKDVPPYAVVMGVPAKVVKYRFDDEVITGLEKMAWWDWPAATIKERFEDFRLPIKEFLAKYSNEHRNHHN